MMLSVKISWLIVSLHLCLLLISWVPAQALQPGDRVSTLTQTLHNGMKSPWMDFPLHQMPRFGMTDKHIYHAHVPKSSTNASDYIINPRQDLKIAFTFLGNKLSIPWTSIYNAKERISMKKLIITFTNDEFEVVRLRYETIYGPKIQKVEASHPALRGFEIEYQWESVQEEDFGAGVITMFLAALLGFLVLFLMILCNGEIVEGPTYLSTSKTKTTSTPARSTVKYSR